METGLSMLVSGIEKISRKVSTYKDFGGNGLPKSNKYSGLPVVAYSVIKRTNEIVEELLRQVESSVKARNEAREVVDQRNYEIAIEVTLSLREKSDEFLLRELARRWNDHKIMVKWLTRFFNYLDRFYVQRKALPSLHEARISGFHELVYKEFKCKAADVVLL
ncbi:paramyosin [Perilla frutescens var. hirtella]|uniref:Paramyosin n=1 Tax=Perilla frutescens var. hirtella TaxID=608512 RepID=A0AAD4JQU9_PERFH|nr:paramyosin [Perilla frutescens var. hirtella]